MIIKLNEGALLAAGFDKSFVALLRHLVAQIGQVTGQTTLPEVADGFAVMHIAPSAQPQIISDDDKMSPVFMAPPAVDDLRPMQEMAQQVESLQMEIRQIAETVTALAHQINDLKQGREL